MNIYFHIEYHTVFGEELVLNIVRKDAEGKDITTQYRMNTTDGHQWTCTLNNYQAAGAVAKRGQSEESQPVLNYFYSVDHDGSEERTEWRTVAHRLELTPAEALCFHVYDRWIDMPEDSYLYSSAFTDCIKTTEPVSPKTTTAEKEVAVRLRMIVRAPQLRNGQQLFIVGENEVLGFWNVDKAVPMTQHNYNEWIVDLDASAFSGRKVEFKFVAIGGEYGTLWETGHNRTVNVGTDLRRGDVVTYQLDQAFFAFCNQRVAGTLVPVFSLRSKGSFGVGDFGDLQKMVDWVAKTGQRLLQVLPINDTTSTHTWTDSYPYSCISVFALHPQYVDLRQLPELKNNKHRLEFESLRKELNALPQIDYERVNNAKADYLRAIFEQEGREALRSDAFKKFFKENELWLVPYAQYCMLRDENGTVDFKQWKGHETWNEEDRKALSNSRTKAWQQASFYYYVQFVLFRQMQAVHEHARQKGVILKGDIPIGVSRVGCDVWMEPKYFNMNGQAGAPPDDFSADGQNWGFPTYNWDEMLKDNCAWWVRRFQNMSHYFDAYRIDHVLGFFRIWEIPMPHASGLMGQFSPALGLSIEEINSWGVSSDIEGLFLIDHKDAEKIERGELKPEKAHWHPRIGVQHTEAYEQLSAWEKDAFNRLYNDYFYRRNNQFWYREAMKKLPRLVQATRMLVCAEDLGMVPDCVQWVMNELRILSLELQSMPKDPSVRFGVLERNPYRSVCTISSHDTPTLRMWWDEDYERSQSYFNQVLWKDGPAPHPMPGWLARDIIANHLASPSMVCVIALQDWLAIDEHLRLQDANAERVNIPANPRHYWRYRMHLNIEDLIGCEGFSNGIAQLIALNGR
ncbi:MAG: 4-alpha-glucanotransferase [Prevotella sp.]|nr:4-alpha-glucanotransferase [Prevotella sp.]